MASYRLVSEFEEGARLVMGDNPLARLRMAVPPEVLAMPYTTGYIEWRLSEEKPAPPSYGFKEGRLARGCLAHFLKLVHASDEQIGAFAREWGVLGFCEHGEPGVHGRCRPAQKSLRGPGWWLDPTEKWRGLAREIGAMLGLAYAILQDKPQDPGHWETLFPRWPTHNWGDVRAGMNSPEIARLFAAGVAVRLSNAGIDPRIWWDERRQGFRFGVAVGGSAAAAASPGMKFKWPPGSLYSVLMTQVSAAMTGGGLALCSECANPFDYEDAGLNHRPRQDKAAYCSNDCRRLSRLRQKREYWHRRKQRDGGQS